MPRWNRENTENQLNERQDVASENVSTTARWIARCLTLLILALFIAYAFKNGNRHSPGSMDFGSLGYVFMFIISIIAVPVYLSVTMLLGSSIKNVFIEWIISIIITVIASPLILVACIQLIKTPRSG